MTFKPLICVVDDDESVRESLPDLLLEFGFEVQAFPSAEEFLESKWIHLTKCLILDVAMPGMTGPELYEEIRNRGLAIPVIFITAHAIEKVRPRIQHLGATECLFKPFNDTSLRAAIDAALQEH
jgi:FixJ family two-component response regulator